MRTLTQISDKVAETGLALRGALGRAPNEPIASGMPGHARTLVLVGFVGAQGWSAFVRSPEASDGRADPLDRWSRRVIDTLARDLGAQALYPFDGPPYLPFQQWAMLAEPVHVSPLGLLIHPDFGLWHSYRGALAFVEAIESPPVPPRANPCETCVGQPCLHACPVGAFAPGGYDVAACVAHLRRPEGRACMDGGCLARRACPVGRQYAPAPAQAAFHMLAFLRVH